MKKMLVALLLMVTGFAGTDSAEAGSGTVANDFSLSLPCVAYNGTNYKLTLKPWSNPADPDWMYWQYESVTAADADAVCSHIDAGLNVTVPSLYYQGINVSLALDYYPQGQGYIWRLNPQIDVNPVTISEISGDTSACFDLADSDFQQKMQQYVQCAQGCAENVQCLMACTPDFGIGSSFSLALTACNPSGDAVEFIIPGGAWFQPQASDVQPMLVIDDQVIAIQPYACTTACIPTYCMDGGAHAPSDSDAYSIADIAQTPCLVEILDLVRGVHDISLTQSNIIQDAVWECQETGSISEEFLTALSTL